MYQVIVGNIGVVYSGGNRKAADANYAEYVEQSRSGYGRAGGENVVMMFGDTPVKEYTPQNTCDLLLRFTIQAPYSSGDFGDLMAQLKMVVEDAVKSLDYQPVCAPVKFIGLCGHNFGEEADHIRPADGTFRHRESEPPLTS